MTDRDNAAVARASHTAYIQAVVEQLNQRGIEATGVVIETSEARRAEMTIAEVDPMNTTWRDTEADVQLLWDERTGWRWRGKYPSEDQPRSAVHFGVSAVPPPVDVAGWMSISLVHPETAVSRTDGPFETPDLDTVLHAYAVT